jgi:hypothetical protein
MVQCGRLPLAPISCGCGQCPLQVLMVGHFLPIAESCTGLTSLSPAALDTVLFTCDTTGTISHSETCNIECKPGYGPIIGKTNGTYTCLDGVVR